MLPQLAAEVMSLAQGGRPAAARSLAENALDQVHHLPDADQAGFWYAVAVLEHTAGDPDAQIVAADRCLELGREVARPGWIANALSMRAMGLVRQGRMEPALLDLARAEVALSEADDAGLRCWAHTGLGYCYLEMRLYELSQPHFEAAQALDASPLPLAQAPVIDLMNLCELHLRWAEELEQVQPDERTAGDVERHRRTAHDYARRALGVAELLDEETLQTCRAMELSCRPTDEALASVAEMEAQFELGGPSDYNGRRVALGGALARTLWSLGRRDEALDVARRTVLYSAAAGDWQSRASALWLLVCLETDAGVPGAHAGRDYAQLLCRVLWKQRLSTLQGAQAALAVERLHRDKVAAQREASQDPLTGVGNRRALDDALRTVAHEIDAGDTRPASLLLVDIDDFKAINDTYGHVVGDEALRGIAAAIRSVARPDDLVARIGGDEFVVLVRHADVDASYAIADRLREAIEALSIRAGTRQARVAASIGVASTGRGVTVADLLARADVHMYDEKARRASAG
jgi:diguanylate cyclase (GGDEF)-like protein